MKINSKSGQGLIELIFIMPWLLLIAIGSFQLFFYLNLELAVDELLDDYLICKMEKNLICIQNIESKINSLPIKIISKNFSQIGHLYQIKLNYTAINFVEINTLRELKFEKNIY